MSLAPAPLGAPLGAQPPLAPGQAVWQWFAVNPEDCKYDAEQKAFGFWWPGNVITVYTPKPGQLPTQLSVRHSNVSVNDVVPREVKKRKPAEAAEAGGTEAAEAGTEEGQGESDNAQAPAAKRPKKQKSTMPPPIAAARLLVLTNDNDSTGERAALLSPMDPMVETQLFIAGSNGVFPSDIGPFHEIVVSYAAGAGKKQPAIDLREMHAMVAKRMGVTPDNLICAIAFDQTANVVCDMDFAGLPNVQLICPHLVKARGGTYAAPKIPAFVLSPAYQNILAELAEPEAKASGSASSASSASSPAKSPAAPPPVPAAVPAAVPADFCASGSASAQPANSPAATPAQHVPAAKVVDLTGDDTEDE